MTRYYKLEKGDIFTIDRKTYNKEIKNNKMFMLTYPKFVWYKPTTWFPKRYKIMYVGEE